MIKRRQQNTVRIISGKHRGRRLKFADVPGLRPSTDRVRETVFSWLGYQWEGARCLDLFAGSGAFGFECLSRGAAYVEFVDIHQRVTDDLMVTAQNLGAPREQWKVVCCDALDYLTTARDKPFDLIFVDPPYNTRWNQAVFEMLISRGWLAGDALVYNEISSTKMVPIFEKLELKKSKKSGGSNISLYWNPGSKSIG